ncbi:hypothetical protein GTO89_05545 [Heliobacterium gestii]|uniref:Uncharacterized protein n=1 Tax=Heliomicrobium gestii TaxID=2699 RepID=A0A845LB19_HELGE|nr:hypothetical protein [Heliomicrobium gestii]MBM7866169.1 hypothetical protein [Heliomicrobium gestii]MZP42504.1 hypothetical protein [Heliomicrobium gestii]
MSWPLAFAFGTLPGHGLITIVVQDPNRPVAGVGSLEAFFCARFRFGQQTGATFGADRQHLAHGIHLLRILLVLFISTSFVKYVPQMAVIDCNIIYS